MGDTSVELALSLRARHPEGPHWDAPTARLWWVDITAQRVHCWDPESSECTSWSTTGQPGGVVLAATGEPVVASPEGLAVLDRSTGALDLRVPIERDRPENRANDIKVDSRGRVWVGTMAFDKRPRNAALYRVDGDQVTRVVDGLTISNGPAFDEASGRLYLADTALCVVDAFDLDLATGALTGRRPFLDFSRDQLWPDGMTVDDEGMLWVSLGRAGAVHRYHADGSPRRRGRAADVESDLAGVRRRRRRRPLHHDILGRLRAARRRTAGGRDFRCRPGVTGQPSPRYTEIPQRGEKA